MWAARRAAHIGVPLTLVRVIPGPWSFRHASRYVEAMNQAAELLAAESRRVAALNPAIQVSTALRTGETALTLRRLSEDADMVVVGTDRRPDRHGEGFGSVSFQTATISNSVVAVVPTTGDESRVGVVAGTDGSADAAEAVTWAASKRSAWARNSRCSTSATATTDPTSNQPVTQPTLWRRTRARFWLRPPPV